MSRLRAWISRLLDPVLARRRDARLSEELQAHLELMADDLSARGVPPAEARLAAQRALGGVAQVTESYRDRRGLPSLDALLTDLRLAARVLARDRRPAAAAILILTLGLGVNTTFFTILYAHCLRGLSIPDAGRVLSISTIDGAGRPQGVSGADFQELRAAATDFEGLAAHATMPLELLEPGRAAERVQATYISATAFALLRERALLGRVPGVEDDRPGAPAAAVIGHRLWTTRFASSQGVLGRSVRIGDTDAAVVGVMREGFEFPDRSDVWLPLSLLLGAPTEPRSARTLALFGRLRADRPIEAGRAQVAAIIDRIATTDSTGGHRLRALVVPINERHLTPLTHPAWLAFLTAGLVVLTVACANTANLMLAWSARRVREIAIRAALGASRARVVRQLLLENALLAAAGGAAGLVAAAGGLRILTSAIPDRALPSWIDYSIDARIVAALGATVIATLFAFGLAPALRASKIDITRTLNEGATSTPRGAGFWTTALLALQFGLTLLLVAPVVHGLRTAVPPPEGEQSMAGSGAVTAAIELKGPRYAEPAQQAEFVSRLLAQTAAEPALRAVAMATALPLQGAAGQALEIEGRPAAGGAAPEVLTVAVTPAYFDVLGLTIQRGRGFADEDGAPGRDVAIVSSRFVELHFPRENPIGRRLRLAPPKEPGAATPWLTIVGVSPTVRQRPAPHPEPVVYRPFRAAPAPAIAIVLQPRADAASAIDAIRAEVAAIGPAVPVFRAAGIRQVLDEAQWVGRVSERLLFSISLVALLLALAGLYAVTARGVALRAREIVIRLALGARPQDVSRSILGRAIRHVLLGVLLGSLLSVAWDAAFGPGVRLPAWQVLLPAAALLVALAVLACIVPALQAMRLSPIEVLRERR